MWQKVQVVFGAVLALVIVIVVLQNTEQVETKLLFVSVTMPRAALLFGTLVVGFVLGALMGGQLLSRAKK
jgi:uncharacterized integral membrane protein